MANIITIRHICILTLSSIYTQLNTLKKTTLGNNVEKGEIAQNEQFHLFPQRFLCNLYLLKATLQLSSAASLNLGRSQNDVLGSGLTLCLQDFVNLKVTQAYTAWLKLLV